MFAAGAGRAAAIVTLLKNGAEVDVATENGTTALTAAAFGGHAAVVTVLLERGSKTEVADKNGMTAVRLAEQNGHTKVAALLAGLKDAENAPLPDEDEDL